jgi:hypothetical protein
MARTPAQIAATKPRFRLPEVREEEIGSARTYRRIAASLYNALMRGDITAVDHDRMSRATESACKQNTGMTLEEAGQQALDKIEGFRGIMAHTVPELEDVIAALSDLPEHRMPAEEKKNHITWLRRAIDLIGQCRRDPAKFCIWVGRDSKTGDVIRLKEFHCRIIEAWTHPEKANSLSEAPPGHGKSSLAYLFIPWELGDNPTLRQLYVTDVKDKSKRAVGVMRRVIQSPQYRAIFPDVFILPRGDGRADDSMQFSVNGINPSSREASVTAASTMGNVNGDGFDRVWGDDFCPPEVREQETLRARVNKKWFQVIIKRLRDHSDARIRITHQCWHDGDACGLTKRDIEEGRATNWVLCLNPVLDDSQGLALPIWPERFDRNFLESEKLKPGYDHLYRLRTTCDADILVPSVHFYHSNLTSGLTRKCDRELAAKLAGAERWLSIDPAATASHTSSFHGVSDIVLGDTGFVFVTDCWFLKLEPIGLLAWVLERLFNAPEPGYAGLHMESQSAMKFGASYFEHDLRKALRTREIPIRNKLTGQWETYTHPRAYKRHLEIVNTDTSFGASGGFKSKRKRLAMAASPLSTPVVKFAGELRVNHRLPRDAPNRYFCGPIPGSKRSCGPSPTGPRSRSSPRTRTPTTTTTRRTSSWTRAWPIPSREEPSHGTSSGDHRPGADESRLAGAAVAVPEAGPRA